MAAFASLSQGVNSVVQRLFRGHFSYVTTCLRCKQQSEGSKRQVEFYELPLQVQKIPSLQASMVSSAQPIAMHRRHSHVVCAVCCVCMTNSELLLHQWNVLSCHVMPCHVSRMAHGAVVRG
jgi:hypothetical protein